MSSCEIVEVRSLEDALGIPCARYAVSTCTDCGTNLCLSHAETCDICRKVFCGACLGFHLDGHAKPAKKHVHVGIKKKNCLDRCAMQVFDCRGPSRGGTDVPIMRRDEDNRAG